MNSQHRLFKLTEMYINLLNMKKTLLFFTVLSGLTVAAQNKNTDSPKKISKAIIIKDGDTSVIDINSMNGVVTSNSVNTKVDVQEKKVKGKTIKTVSVISTSEGNPNINLDSLLQTIDLESMSNEKNGKKSKSIKVVKQLESSDLESFSGKKGDIKVMVIEEAGSNSEKLIMSMPRIVESNDSNVIHDFNIEKIIIKDGGSSALIMMDSVKKSCCKIPDNKVVLYINGDTTEINLPKKATCKKVNTKTTAIDIGFNQWMYGSNGISPTSGNELLKLKGTSLGVNIFALRSVNIAREKFRFQTGIGYESGNYKFSNNIGITSNGTDSLFVSEYHDGSTLIKTKLRTGYLDVPFMLEYRSNPYEEQEGFRFAAGIEGGYLLGSLVKRNFKDATGEEQKTKTRGDYLLSDMKLAAVARIGFDDWSFFARYGLTNVFRNDVVYAPQVNPVMFGITIGGF